MKVRVKIEKETNQLPFEEKIKAEFIIEPDGEFMVPDIFVMSKIGKKEFVFVQKSHIILEDGIYAIFGGIRKRDGGYIDYYVNQGDTDYDRSLVGIFIITPGSLFGYGIVRVIKSIKLQDARYDLFEFRIKTEDLIEDIENLVTSITHVPKAMIAYKQFVERSKKKRIFVYEATEEDMRWM